jgi:hypothetical protein
VILILFRDEAEQLLGIDKKPSAEKEKTEREG